MGVRFYDTAMVFAVERELDIPMPLEGGLSKGEEKVRIIRGSPDSSESLHLVFFPVHIRVVLNAISQVTFLTRDPEHTCQQSVHECWSAGTLASSSLAATEAIKAQPYDHHTSGFRHAFAGALHYSSFLLSTRLFLIPSESPPATWPPESLPPSSTL